MNIHLPDNNHTFHRDSSVILQSEPGPNDKYIYFYKNNIPVGEAHRNGCTSTYYPEKKLLGFIPWKKAHYGPPYTLYYHDVIEYSAELKSN